MKCGVCEKQITIFTKCHDCGQGIILEQMTNKPVQNFHCNNKGRHYSDPGYKPVCSKQCAECSEYYPGSIYQPLFDHMHDEHGLILLDSEMQEIIHIVNKIQSKEDGK
jgi:hypothetical protein